MCRALPILPKPTKRATLKSSSMISGSVKCSCRRANVSSEIARWFVAARSAYAIAARSASVRSGASSGRSSEQTSDLGDAVLESLLVPDGHAAPALVPERDAKADELDQPVGQQPLLAERLAEREECLRDLGTLRVDLHAQRRLLAEQRAVHVDGGGRDAGHR